MILHIKSKQITTTHVLNYNASNTIGTRCVRLQLPHLNNALDAHVPKNDWTLVTEVLLLIAWYAPSKSCQQEDCNNARLAIRRPQPLGCTEPNLKRTRI